MADNKNSTKPKCKYWENCYQKSESHKKNYLHPSDMDDDNEEDSDEEVDSKKETISLVGKRILFTGRLDHDTRKMAAGRAEGYGCVIRKTVSKQLDIVIVGEDAGSKADEAKALGIRVVEEGEWEQLLAEADKAPEEAVKRAAAKRRKDAAQSDDSGDEDYAPSKANVPKTKKKKVEKKNLHQVSDSEDEDKSEVAESSKVVEGRKRKLHDVSGSEDDEDDDDAAESSTPQKRKKPDPNKIKAGKSKPKCRYGAKCYRTNEDHLKDFRHPGSDDDDESESSTSETDTKDVKAKNEMHDGDEVVSTGDTGTFTLKRQGSSYSCTCNTWKNQSRSVVKRTCRHLKEHLGTEFEEARLKAYDKSVGTVKITRSPRHKNIAQLLLAQKYKESVDPTGWWLSEKLDGVRAYWDGKSFYSRLGNEFIPPPWFVKGFPADMELDGELFGGRGKFQSTVSIVKNPGIGKWKELKYQIFDAPHVGHKPFEERMDCLKSYFEKNDLPYAELLKQSKCKGREHIKEELKRVEALGGEGLMIREPKSVYDNCRSSTLLKIKTFHDAEAIVIGYEKGKGKNSSVVGALVCKMECGKTFKVGSGLTDQNRRHPPKKGSIICYRFQEYTNSGMPRFPTYVGIRLDMTKPKDAVLPKKPSDD